MMEPVKRIEGASDSQGQAAMLAEAVQTRYWMKQAEATEKTVQKSDNAENPNLKIFKIASWNRV